METILIGRDRSTGKDVIIAGREVPYPQKMARYKELAATINTGNDEFSNVVLIQDQHIKKPLKFLTKAQAEERSKAQAQVKNEEPKPKAEKSAKKSKAEKSEQP